MSKITLIILLGLLAVPALGSPLFDPFMESFQVGAYLDTAELDMVGVWPAGLLTPVKVDTAWTAQAVRLLGDPEGFSQALTHRFLAQVSDAPLGGAPAMARAVLSLQRPLEVSPGNGVEPGYLLKERWTQAVFLLLENGQPRRAHDLVVWGLARPDLGLRDRERFIWEMRRGNLAQMAGLGVRPLERPWAEDADLGPYDRSCVWALWTAHRRAADLPVLPPDFHGPREAVRLAGLRDPDITPAELEASAFSPDEKAGLGATWFSGEALAEHLRRYPDPPAGLSAQGWWAKGQRFLKRGQTRHYSQLAARGDLRGDWRLDIWRRTSEIHLLAGRWEAGLQALDRALDLAAAGEGTTGLRRLLRHWVEQATVLALAQGKDETARELLARGDRAFEGEEGDSFAEETANWRTRKRQGKVKEKEILARSRQVVARGMASDARSTPGPDHARKKQMVRAADRSLWPLWFKWGISLSQADGLSPEVAVRAGQYADLLKAGQKDPDGPGEKTALAAIARRFSDEPSLLAAFLGKMVDRDVGRLSGWGFVPEPSPVPALLPRLRGSQLDMHAALGLALATGDMRGMLGLSYELPAAGLTRDEKRYFLYPLPPEGPIRQALLAADSDPALILAVARNESLFEPAVRSRAGALGYMQIMPFHFRDRGAVPGLKHWGIPAVSIDKGDRLLEDARRRYGNDPYRQLAAYNAGPGATDRWNKQLGGVPDRDIFLAWIGYTETRNYVEKVLIDREIYDWLLQERSRP